MMMDSKYDIKDSKWAQASACNSSMNPFNTDGEHFSPE